MARRADIDLLFGILALQNGFIDQGTLFAAFATWARGRPGRWPRSWSGGVARRPGPGPARGARREAPASGTGETPARPGRASARSTRSARNSRSSATRSWRPASRPRRTSGTGGTTHTAGLVRRSAAPNTSEGTRFRILRLHARGGWARSSSPATRELDREVALKEIRDRLRRRPASTGRGSCSRPRSPAGWSIPGIVPVYGLGRTPTAGPITRCGSSGARRLKEAIAAVPPRPSPRTATRPRAALALRKLLRHFLDVCNAMDYAHSRGRDPPRPQAGQRHARASTARPWSSTGAWPSRWVGPTPGDRGRTSGRWPRIRRAGVVGRRYPGSAVGTPGLHEPRAGRGRARPGRPGQRRLQPGGHPLSPPDRPAPVRGRRTGRDPPGGPARGRSRRPARSTASIDPAAGGDLPQGDGPGTAEAATPRPGRWPTTSSAGWPTSR